MKNGLLCTTALVLCLSFAPASAQQKIVTPILPTAENFRDIAGIAASVNSVSTGGTGFVDSTSNNGVMRTGIFYRSQALNALNGEDSKTITSLNVRHDIDLRTLAEWDPAWIPPGNPDKVPSGATWININIYNSENVPSTDWIKTEDNARSYMNDTYRDFVRKSDERGKFREVLLYLANVSPAEAALYHCSGGKDRTGWTSMLLQTIAGVPMATIQQDYLATNVYTKKFIDVSTIALIAQDKSYLIPMLGVDLTYLQAGLDQLAASGYASLYAYLTQGLGLTLADIYVLRAKMVYFSMLPGQGSFVGNAAAGAAFLNALQNSPLSGRYTAFNYYLQSAIDAGTLGGVETQVGGQVHADAVAYLARLPLWVDAAVTPYASGRDLGAGHTRLWLAGVGGYFGSDGRAGIAGSTERSGGSIMGATYRVDHQFSAYFGIGDIWGSVASAGASADINTAVATFGGRYGFSTLDAGPYVTARMTAGWADYQSKRAMGGGLGIAQGHSNGAVYSGRADLGSVVRLAPVTVTPQIGFRVANVSLGGFTESGSDLALAVSPINYASSSLLADVDVSLDPQRVNGWSLAPSVAFGYERALGNPQVDSSACLYGFAVSQSSAYASRNLMKVSVAVTARRDALTVKAGVNALRGDDSSSGLNAQLSIGYTF